MMSEEQLLKWRDSILLDPRLSYKTATLAINAPLAFVQLAMEVELTTIEVILGIPRTNINQLRGET